jgi:hypothetical protein
MRLLDSALLTGVRAAFAPVARGFHAATAQPQLSQERVLAELAKSCSRTEYGQEHGVRTAEDFRARLPIAAYEDLSVWIDAQQKCEQRALVADPVLFYEKTSGSTGPAKYIPYTAALRRSFTRMFAVWAHDVLTHSSDFARTRSRALRPLKTGVLYFSISPSFAHESKTAQGVKVGMDDDADYLGPLLKRGLSHFFVSSDEAKHAPDAESWKRAVVTSLIQRADLEVISVWNPSMLSVLCDHIEQHRHELAALLRGDVRARALSGARVDYQKLWPELKLISAWDCAAARPLAEALRRRLPHVTLQGKGLLATEAPLTVPLYAAGGAVPMVDEVLFELECVRTKKVCLLHEATIGGSYELIISQRGGLSRYRMGDRVRVGHTYGRTPTLEFVGRGGGTSDLVGEKLQEGFVADALSHLPLDFASFWSLVPVRSPHDHYVLLVDREPADHSELAGQIDAALSRAHHYAHARALGQLGPVRILVKPRAADAVRDHHLRRGMKLGDIKHRLLFTEPADELISHGASA